MYKYEDLAVAAAEVLYGPGDWAVVECADGWFRIVWEATVPEWA